MVVKSIKLGQYSGLDIQVDPSEIDRQIVIQAMKDMILEKAKAAGSSASLDDQLIIFDDNAARKLEISGVYNLGDLEEHVRRSVFRDFVINKVMRQVLDNVSIEYNEKEVDNELEKMIASIEEQAALEGFTIEFFCDYKGIKDMDELRALYRDEIYTSYLEIYALESIAHKEAITIDESKLERVKIEYAMRSFEEDFDESALRRSLTIKETVNWLVLNNTNSVA